MRFRNGQFNASSSFRFVNTSPSKVRCVTLPLPYYYLLNSANVPDLYQSKPLRSRPRNFIGDLNEHVKLTKDRFCCLSAAKHRPLFGDRRLKNSAVPVVHLCCANPEINRGSTRPHTCALKETANRVYPCR